MKKKRKESCLQSKVGMFHPVSSKLFFYIPCSPVSATCRFRNFFFFWLETSCDDVCDQIAEPFKKMIIIISTLLCNHPKSEILYERKNRYIN